MAERGMNPYIKAFIYFMRSLKPSKMRQFAQTGTVVGTDHHGNRYFEIPPDPSRGMRNPTRYFKPTGTPMDNWDTPIPPEWNAWLRQQREDAPSEEEMQFNLNRIAKLEAMHPPKAPKPPTIPTDGSFPKLPEYEESPGAKYKR